MDLSIEDNCKKACEGAVEVYNLAADMGGMGFIERFRIECLRSILINTHMIEARLAGGSKTVFLLIFGLRIQRRTAKRPQIEGIEGIGRVSGYGGKGLWLGKAYVRDVLPGILGGKRP